MASTSKGVFTAAKSAARTDNVSVIRVDWRERTWKRGPSRAHAFDDLVPELRRRHLGRSRHLAREIVGNPTGADGVLDAAYDPLGDFGPAHVLEHHDTGEDHAPGIDLVEIGVLLRGAVRR